MFASTQSVVAGQGQSSTGKHAAGDSAMNWRTFASRGIRERKGTGARDELQTRQRLLLIGDERCAGRDDAVEHALVGEDDECEGARSAGQTTGCGT